MIIKKFIYVWLFSITLGLAGCSAIEGQDSLVEVESERGAIGKADAPGSCTLNSCGGQSPDGCWCDEQCDGFGDCCSDKQDVCEADPAPEPEPEPTASCEGACGGQSSAGCWCDEQCQGAGDCCDDVTEVCAEEPEPVLGCVGNVSYQVTANLTWNPSNVPNPHWSPLIGGSHNSSVSFWSEGQVATPGVQVMAETGAPGPLASEISSQIGVGVNQVIQGSGVPDSPGSTATTFSMNPDFSLVTLSTMVAPSPDWFVGVSGLDLCGANGWVDSVSIDMNVFDGGTDSGTFFTSPDAPTSPKQPVGLHPGFVSNGQLVPLGTMTFQRL